MKNGELTPGQKAAKGARLIHEKGVKVLDAEKAAGTNKKFIHQAVEVLANAPDIFQFLEDGSMDLKDALSECETNARLEAFERHPYSAIWGDLADADKEALRNDIEKNGLHHPDVFIYEDKVLDGWHRLQACIALGRLLDVKVKLFDGSEAEALDFTVSENLTRRQLSKGQLTALAYDASKESKVGRPAGNSQMFANFLTRDEAARIFGTTGESIRQFRKIVESEQHELADAVRQGEMTLGAAYAKVPRPKPEGDEAKPSGAQTLVQASSSKTGNGAASPPPAQTQTKADNGADKTTAATQTAAKEPEGAEGNGESDADLIAKLKGERDEARNERDANSGLYQMAQKEIAAQDKQLSTLQRKLDEAPGSEWGEDGQEGVKELERLPHNKLVVRYVSLRVSYEMDAGRHALTLRRLADFMPKERIEEVRKEFEGLGRKEIEEALAANGEDH